MLKGVDLSVGSKTCFDAGFVHLLVTGCGHDMFSFIDNFRSKKTCTSPFFL